MKALLWLLLLAAVAVNISTSILFDGTQQALLSIGTGVVALASGLALYLTRPKRS
ncbi:hypothetical protein ACIQNU_34170 [Streptomyces sp. NPDC091292]|uniref:hypothetical protein n=1 Tax=Streptomyces sp. NPDC091292 TaxID=3365991 RepID=UPI0037F1852C